MKLTQISINGLFGYLNHEIKLSRDKDITLIHGPNGCGKTTILELTTAIFRSDYRKLRSVPFHLIDLRFHDTGRLRITKTVEEKAKIIRGRKRLVKSTRFEYTYSKRGMKPKTYEVTNGGFLERRFPLSIIEREIPELARTDREEWVNIETDEVLTLEDVQYRYSDRLPYLGKHRPRPPWLSDLIHAVEVYYIRSQRLISRRPRRIRDEDAFLVEDITDTIEIYARELGKTISEKLAESVSISQSKDRTFPARLLDRSSVSDQDETDLRKKYAEIEFKRQALTEVGLIDEEQGVPLAEHEMSVMEKKVLGLYLADTAQKLEIFDNLLNKLTAFTEIVNGKMSDTKVMKIDRKNGFYFRSISPDSPTLELKNLSSGEQHQAVLFYELLFKTEENALILIDEPEISLHVEWQRQFLKDLERVTSLISHSFLIATHSPQIIHDRWDLAVALSGGIERE